MSPPSRSGSPAPQHSEQRPPLGVKGPGKSAQHANASSGYAQSFVQGRASQEERQLERELGLGGGSIDSADGSTQAPGEDGTAPVPASSPQPQQQSPHRPRSSAAASAGGGSSPQGGGKAPSKTPSAASSSSRGHGSPLSKPSDPPLDPPSKPASLLGGSSSASAGGAATHVLSALQAELAAVKELRSELQAMKSEQVSASVHGSASQQGTAAAVEGGGGAREQQLRALVAGLRGELAAGKEAVAAAKAERDGYLAERAGWLAQLRAENEQLQALYAQTSTAKANMRADLAALNAAHESLEEERVAVRQREDMMMLFIQGRGMGPAYAAFLQDRASGADGAPLALPAPATPRPPVPSGVFAAAGAPHTVSPPGIRRSPPATASQGTAAARGKQGGALAQLHALASKPL